MQPNQVCYRSWILSKNFQQIYQSSECDIHFFNVTRKYIFFLDDIVSNITTVK
jgi:hypothetical protein